MGVILGLDIGTNSVGSAWIDTDEGTVDLGVGIFPAGVKEKPDGSRGDPKNQDRRSKRSLRRSLRRRAERKQKLRRVLTEHGLLPTEPDELKALFSQEEFDPWQLRSQGLDRELTPHEFGRCLLHLVQRRGALGVDADSDDEAGLVKEAIGRLREELGDRTVGQFMVDEQAKRKDEISGTKASSVNQPIRNRLGEFRWHADRLLIHEEFDRLWEHQSSYKGELAGLLTDELRTALDDPETTDTWRHQGALFGQRQIYWDTGTLGRCDLEPSDHQCPKCGMYAQEFLVLEYVNNLKIDRDDGTGMVPLTKSERDSVIEKLRTQKTASIATLKKALRIDKASLKKQNLPDTCHLNAEADQGRKPNTDAFYRTIVHGVFGEEVWNAASEEFRDDVNKQLLRYEPSNSEHEQKLRAVAERFWDLDESTIDKLIVGWKERPKKDTRIKLSRRALKNLLPYLRDGLSISEARKEFSEDLKNGATPEQRQRYAMSGAKLTKADRHFMEKHHGVLPPAPPLSNPVVRKAIHEVRRQVNAWIQRKGHKPKYIVVELAREASQPTHVRNDILLRNRKRDVIRKKIIDDFGLESLRKNRQSRAIERVLLCRQQKGVSAYSGKPITDRMAADGIDLEVDHIVPRSRSHDNSMANKVLVFRDENRNKGNRTVKEWLANDPAGFGTVEQSLRHLSEGSPDIYFTRRECSRKWDNIHRDAPTTENFHASQLTDTAYAARQIVGYLKNALYHDAPDPETGGGQRKVFTTKGQYTAILRRDWGLPESLLEQQLRGDALPPTDEQENAPGEAGRPRRGLKDRRDHIHHAIDAVAIAFCREGTIQKIAHAAQDQEEARASSGHWPDRKPVDPPDPWESVEEFRQCVLDAAKELVISHRAVKRKLTGAFHEETLLGPVINDVQQNEKHRTENSDTLFTNRISADALKPNHLRVPDGWDEQSAKLDDPSLTKAQRKDIRKTLNAMPDPSPGKSGIVRDRELRDQIRRCLNRSGLNPDKFDPKALKPLIDAGQLCMASGVPIKRVILLRTLTGPVRIDRRHWNEELGRKVPATDEETRRREQRVYVGGNNHHLEIREDSKTGKWSGHVVSTFDAAKRVRGVGQEKADAVNRSDIDGKQFVMSLAEGETIFCRRADRPDDEPSYYVVAKLDRRSAGQDIVHFVAHWDARTASEQDRWKAKPSDLQALGQSPEKTPYKVQVGPLGDVQRRND